MILKWNDKNIINFVESITWGGSAYQASRTLEFTVLYSPLDKNIKDYNIKLGDRIKLYDDKKRLLINAMVYTRERKSNNGTITYSCMDDMNRLLRSRGTYNLKNTTPERITQKVCKDLNIQMGAIAKTNVTIKTLLVDAESFYTIILKAYTKAHKANSKKYIPIMVNQKLSVVEKGEIVANFTLNDKVNIISSSYSETIDNMVNKVKIYDAKGKQVGEVSNKALIDKYGIFQDAYAKEDGVNATTASKAMLSGVDKSASIEALGNVECIAGYGVKIKDSITKLTGIFWIDSDTHTWRNGVHTMSLELMFKNIMELDEDHVKLSKKKKKKKKKRKKKIGKKWDGITVYLGANSTKFHKTNICSGIKHIRIVTKDEAERQGYGYCRKCFGGGRK